MYSIQEVSEKTGLTPHTLRYYEKEGLLGRVERSAGGVRQYSDADLDALGAICCLKNTGMSLEEIARFMSLAQEGDSSLRQRTELLQAHRQRVIERLAEMQAHLDKVTRKLDWYTERLRAYEAQNGKEETA